MISFIWIPSKSNFKILLLFTSFSSSGDTPLVIAHFTKMASSTYNTYSVSYSVFIFFSIQKKRFTAEVLLTHK